MGDEQRARCTTSLYINVVSGICQLLQATVQSNLNDLAMTDIAMLGRLAADIVCRETSNVLRMAAVDYVAVLMHFQRPWKTSVKDKWKDQGVGTQCPCDAALGFCEQIMQIPQCP